MYPAEAPFPVYCPECWWSDSWDGTNYAMEIDFAKPFLSQFKELLTKVPRASLMASLSVNSPYANMIYQCKNVYLSSSTMNSEDVLYSWAADGAKSCMDCQKIENSELCYECVDIERCYNVVYSLKCKDCVDSRFLYDCVNCKNCFLSSNLRNREYVFKNVQYSRDEYLKKLKEYQPGSHQTHEKAVNEFIILVGRSLHRYANIIRSPNSSGDNIHNAKNAQKSFDVYDVEDVKYAFRSVGEKDSMDIMGAGPGSNHTYEGISTGIEGSMQRFCAFTWENVFDLDYCYNVHNVSHSFGCTGLRKKQYCILNKQYTEEAYAELKNRIIQHMKESPYRDIRGRPYPYGEFFPLEFSPFAYNQTLAQEYYPLDKKTAEEQGYKWKDPETRSYKISMPSNAIPDSINDVTSSILKEVLGCAHRGNCDEQCTTAFKLTSLEFELYKKINLPLPRLCPNCRHYQKIKRRNPMKLWHRTCCCAGVQSENSSYQNNGEHFHGNSHCPNEFETSYAPERPEVVYCETCYQSEVV